MPKAKLAQICIGSNLSVEGLELPDGSFAVSVSQVATLFSVDSRQASRTLKPLLGDGFQFDKLVSELHPKAVNILSLTQFETVMIELAIKGNSQAIALLRALAGMALSELFKDAFDRASDAATRQVYLNAIADLANPWERLVDRKSMSLIHTFYGNHCSESFWWKYIYHFLSDAERSKLDSLNPVDPETKQRKTRIHQWIRTEEGIRERLTLKVLQVVTLLGSATSRQDFETRSARLQSNNQHEINA